MFQGPFDEAGCSARTIIRSMKRRTFLAVSAAGAAASVARAGSVRAAEMPAAPLIEAGDVKT